MGLCRLDTPPHRSQALGRRRSVIVITEIAESSGASAHKSTSNFTVWSAAVGAAVRLRSAVDGPNVLVRVAPPALRARRPLAAALLLLPIRLLRRQAPLRGAACVPQHPQPTQPLRHLLLVNLPRRAEIRHGGFAHDEAVPQAHQRWQAAHAPRASHATAAPLDRHAQEGGTQVRAREGLQRLVHGVADLDPREAQVDRRKAALSVQCGLQLALLHVDQLPPPRAKQRRLARRARLHRLDSLRPQPRQLWVAPLPLLVLVRVGVVVHEVRQRAAGRDLERRLRVQQARLQRRRRGPAAGRRRDVRRQALLHLRLRVKVEPQHRVQHGLPPRRRPVRVELHPLSARKAAAGHDRRQLALRHSQLHVVPLRGVVQGGTRRLRRRGLDAGAQRGGAAGVAALPHVRQEDGPAGDGAGEVAQPADVARVHARHPVAGLRPSPQLAQRRVEQAEVRGGRLGAGEECRPRLGTTGRPCAGVGVLADHGVAGLQAAVDPVHGSAHARRLLMPLVVRHAMQNEHADEGALAELVVQFKEKVVQLRCCPCLEAHRVHEELFCSPPAPLDEVLPVSLRLLVPLVARSQQQPSAVHIAAGLTAVRVPMVLLEHVVNPVATRAGVAAAVRVAALKAHPAGALPVKLNVKRLGRLHAAAGRRQSQPEVGLHARAPQPVAVAVAQRSADLPQGQHVRQAAHQRPHAGQAFGRQVQHAAPRRRVIHGTLVHPGVAVAA
mmetsp:Transcript_14171/g.36720  ORF Transcript_14171/g.36720 Transcript_14171/m.36720 type:complete len:723 (+) Transcript_14171:319-2487(+)